MQHQLCVWLVSGEVTDPDAHGILEAREIASSQGQEWGVL